MGLELAEQLDWALPDFILYPTGGGTGLIGMWKAFHEMAEMGWINHDSFPRMVAVQSDGCCPIVRAFQQGDRFAEPFENAATAASGLRVPVAVGDFMILDAVRESNGLAVAARESELDYWQGLAMQKEGISICPETAACIGALDDLMHKGIIDRNDRVVVFNTGAAQKYVPCQAPDLPTIDEPANVDWDRVIGDAKHDESADR